MPRRPAALAGLMGESEHWWIEGAVVRGDRTATHATDDQRLLESRGATGWVHTDPWRVLRIQSEFIDGFGTLAELCPAVSVFGSARTPRVLDTEYWSGLIEWLRSVAFDRGTISAADLEAFTITDDPYEAVSLMLTNQSTLTQPRRPE
jgi:hypothetical protein